MSCEMNSWVLSAHLPRQSSKRSLPDFREQIIDLGSGGYGALMAWVHYFFRKPFGNNANNALMQFHADTRWTPETANTATTPRFTETNAVYNMRSSSLWVRDGSYLKLKNVTIGYNFTDKKMLKKLGIQQLGIKLTGYNLLTFDKFDIMDPECNPNNADSYPIIKIYNLGINLTF